MLKTLRKLAFASSCLVAASMPAQAHFQLVYTPDVNITKAGEIPVKLIFWHPFENGHVMDMGTPREFYVMHRGENIDLKSTLSEFSFAGTANSAVAYDGSLLLKRSGDYVMVVVPEPYYEESEDIYIQQLTKSYVNRNEIPTDWTEPQGLATEILPLNRPTNVVAGSTFTGRVLSEGKPVPGVEVEIEYMAAEPDMATNSPKAPTASPMPGGAIVAISDENGYFTFGIPKSGFWGFAALGSGPEKEFQGKELSQDAVLWVRAYDVK
ncbi:DUF4198 domain-containing protein [Thalassospira australica]|uniref:DUF4198 domain-containing protein n=1 Tax=Thalassospira australica TaxID=1528106 RepID=UPI00051A7692|nr:DUF4198 domain-containing protein [Thalassospira australica]